MSLRKEEWWGIYNPRAGQLWGNLFRIRESAVKMCKDMDYLQLVPITVSFDDGLEAEVAQDKDSVFMDQIEKFVLCTPSVGGWLSLQRTSSGDAEVSGVTWNPGTKKWQRKRGRGITVRQALTNMEERYVE